MLDRRSLGGALDEREVGRIQRDVEGRATRWATGKAVEMLRTQSLDMAWHRGLDVRSHGLYHRADLNDFLMGDISRIVVRNDPALCDSSRLGSHSADWQRRTS